MRKIICALFTLAFLSTGMQAKDVNSRISEAVDQAAAQAQANASPNFDIWGYFGISYSTFLNPAKYMDHIINKAQEILGEKEFITLKEIEQNGLLNFKWSDFSAQEQENLKKIADKSLFDDVKFMDFLQKENLTETVNKQGRISRLELIALLCLLDAHWEPESSRAIPLHLDGYFAVSDSSGLANVEAQDFRWLYKEFANDLHRAEDREKYIGGFWKEAEKLPLINADGTTNRENVEKIWEMSSHACDNKVRASAISYECRSLFDDFMQAKGVTITNPNRSNKHYHFQDGSIFEKGLGVGWYH